MSARGPALSIALTIFLLAAWPVAQVARGNGSKEHDHKAHDHGEHDHTGSHDAPGHLHAPVPPEYRSAHVPSAAWTDPRMLARGREIYASRCALCHGEEGRGDGPAAAALPLKPPDLRDTVMVGEMAGNYWFWRVSEGGLVEPFRSQGSIMPAWKDELSVEDRWAVIAYQHTFSGHTGPHVTSEHPQLISAAHASHGAQAGAAAAGQPPSSQPAVGAPGTAKPTDASTSRPAEAGGHKH